MKILYTPDRIAERVTEMGAEITDYYRGCELTVVVLMTGGLYFAADLTRAIKLSSLKLDSLSVASYTDDKSTEKLDIRSRLKLNPAGREILVVDEVLDTGITLRGIKDYLLAHGANRVRSAVMVEKDVLRPKNGLERADWVGFYTGPHYLVGYGLDSEERYRNLPYLAALKD